MQPPAPREPRTRRFALPTSFGGVAAVAEGPALWKRSWQFVFAVATAVVSVWAFDLAWGRAIQRAIASLPDQGRIEQGALKWPVNEAQILHQGPALAIVVDPVGLRERGLATDLTISLESDRIAFRSLFGWSAVRYPPDLSVSLARLDMAGAAAAWRMPFYLALGTAVFVMLLVSWSLLSLTYGLVVWIGALALGRPTTFRIARRLAAASLLPGCLLMIFAMGLYATRQLGLLGLLAAIPLHVVLGWVYCAGSWTRLHAPDTTLQARGPNPFSTPPPAPVRKLETQTPSNPFQSAE